MMIIDLYLLHFCASSVQSAEAPVIQELVSVHQQAGAGAER